MGLLPWCFRITLNMIETVCRKGSIVYIFFVCCVTRFYLVYYSFITFHFIDPLQLELRFLGFLIFKKAKNLIFL